MVDSSREPWQIAGFLLQMLKDNGVVTSVTISYAMEPAATRRVSFVLVTLLLMCDKQAANGEKQPTVLEFKGHPSSSSATEGECDSLKNALANALPVLWSLCHRKWPNWSKGLLTTSGMQLFFRENVPGFGGGGGGGDGDEDALNVRSAGSKRMRSDAFV